MPKKRAFVRYSKQGKIVPGSLILTSGSFPQGSSTWSEVPADLCCEFPAIIVSPSKKRAFVRYTKGGKIVPGSLIITNGTYPSGPSTWKEIQSNLCCGLVTEDSLLLESSTSTNEYLLQEDGDNILL